MARRHATNPQKVKADVRAIQGAPAQACAQRVTLGRKTTTALLAVLSAVLLLVAFQPFGQWYLAFVALVPWVLVVEDSANPRWSMLWACLSGLLFWLAAVYWLWFITFGLPPLLLYLTAYWFAAALVVRGASRRGWPMWLVLPVTWVSLEYARYYVISGFPFFNLAQTQVTQTTLIQIADATGEYGVSFFVAMVNGAIIDLIHIMLARRAGRSGTGVPPVSLPVCSARKEREETHGRDAHATNRVPLPLFLRQCSVAGLVATVLCAAGMLAYGTWRLWQANSHTVKGPVIGIVQQAFPISLFDHKDDPASPYNHGKAEDLTKGYYDASQDPQLANANCDVVLWPETMLPRGCNSEFLDLNLSRCTYAELRSLGGIFFGHERAAELSRGDLELNLRWIRGDELPGVTGPRGTRLKQTAQEMQGLSMKLQCPLLVGGASLHKDPQPVGDEDIWVTRNSALWFDRSDRNSMLYSKMHLVPFGEYVPFRRSWPWLHRLLKKSVPPAMENLDEGAAPVQFDLTARNGTKFAIATPICFEGTFGRVCRKLVNNGDGKPANMILANLSNDGWFDFGPWLVGHGQVRGSTELPQHLAQYCFRAVENRVPVVRAVNTGISASIDSAGRVVAGLGPMKSGLLVLDGRRSNDSEFLPGHGPQILVDDRVTVYSLAGDVFAQLVSAAAVAVLAILILKKRIAKTRGAKA
jgi:apolipoprotein N-acyltransferase